MSRRNPPLGKYERAILAQRALQAADVFVQRLGQRKDGVGVAVPQRLRDGVGHGDGGRGGCIVIAFKPFQDGKRADLVIWVAY